MGIALSQILRLNIVIFTSLDHMPVVPVSPLLPCTATKAIFLGYSIGQPELYHSVVSLENVNEVIPPHVSSTSTSSNHSPKEQVPEHCLCGRGSAKKDGRKFCCQIPNGNKSRCKCYSKIAGCSHRCKCVGCGNPYGSSQAAKQAYTHVTTSRYRPKKKLQEVREHLQSWLSDESRFNSSIWMVRDWKSYIRLSCELRIFEGLSIEPSRVYEYYSKLHDISKNLGSPLQPKKAKQIDGKLPSIKKVAEGFEALYKKQVELNWFWLDRLFWIL